ncbi:MAG: type II toxin-antitoxin system death-on-curing family toxin [Candidatus Sabulitectum sp.]|nr:type II toxin-antitoxin system death-on-curing family toxin [Candidatus Sabulitectum sp.]
MSQIVFISVVNVIEIHRRLINEFGGDPGLRDRGLLESAVAMPGATFSENYLHPELSDMAAAYLFHLCSNHPFINGNKRVAVAASEVFLLANNCTLCASNEELEETTVGTAKGYVSKKEVTHFFTGRVKQP